MGPAALGSGLVPPFEGHHGEHRFFFTLCQLPYYTFRLKLCALDR